AGRGAEEPARRHRRLRPGAPAAEGVPLIRSAAASGRRPELPYPAPSALTEALCRAIAHGQGSFWKTARGVGSLAGRGSTPSRGTMLSGGEACEVLHSRDAGRDGGYVVPSGGGAGRHAGRPPD